MKDRHTLEKQAEMLTALTRAQSTYITESKPREAFGELLELLLSVTESEYGFIGEVMYREDGTPYLKTYAITDISWDHATRTFYEENAPAGLEFTNMATLFGQVITSGNAVIANDPSKDPRSGGIPADHPDLNAFLGLPFFLKDDLLGMVGVANRQGGYDEEIAAFLDPLLSTCAHLIRGHRLEQDRQDSRKREAALMQGLENAHRTEALGRLAGGIAHDFNNLLSLVGCSSEMIAAAADSDSEIAADAAAITHATQRGTLLANQLLTFARTGEFNPSSTDFNSCVSDGLKILRRLLGNDIEIVATLSDDVGRVWMDPVRLEHIIVNLGVNARDAMPHGGKLRVETTRVELNGSSQAQLIMSDEGTGMDDATQAKIFDPFFTTKDPGKGTGLGLAMCQGAVQSADGTIEVSSKAGEGTTFTIWIPNYEGATDEAPDLVASITAEASTGQTILVAEDEPRLRDLTERILAAAGYNVVTASDGYDAERVAKNHQGTIDLLITDMIMPGVGGYELAQRLRESIPNIMFMSGYMGALEQSDVAASWPVLSKPFTSRQLLAKVSEALAEVTA